MVAKDSTVREHQTDLGNAKRLVAQHSDDLRYCHPWRKWLVWDGQRWLRDETGEAIRRAKDTVARIYAEAAAISDDKKREAVARWALQSESDHRIRAMIRLAESEPGIAVGSGGLDSDPWLFNVLNGSLDLRTGLLHPHRRGDLITKLAPVTHHPKAQCPLWLAFLHRIFDDNEALISYIQRFLGYALTGDVSEQQLQVWWGVGANGKSTLINLMLALMGDYAKMAAPGLLLGKSHHRHPTEVADLKGARLVTSLEIGERRKLDEELVKRLTGGDRLKGRLMRQDFWEFDPTHKLVVACNHKPVVRGTDHAMWRRVKLVPFNVVIPDDQQDKRLLEKLKGELSGILNWLLDGCLEWQSCGLGEPEEIKAATADYRDEEDTIREFLTDYCVVEESATVTNMELYQRYVEWCKHISEAPLAKREFNNRLAARGFERDRNRSARYWKGIGLPTPGDGDGR